MRLCLPAGRQEVLSFLTCLPAGRLPSFLPTGLPPDLPPERDGRDGRLA